MELTMYQTENSRTNQTKKPGLKSVLAGLVLTLGLSGTALAEQTLEQALTPILDAETRSADNRARDQYRHPAETLAFFEVLPTHTVVEIWPGRNGWYTEILAPLLRDQGLLYAAHWDVSSAMEYLRTSREAFDQKLAAAPGVYDKVVVSVLQLPNQTEIAPAGSADRVLTFRNVHNWMKAGQADDVFAAMFAALKPGGLLGVVEHRALPDTSDEQMISSGYVTEARVIELAGKAGFELVASSEINANPKDDTVHPSGVWTLPPSLRGDDADKAKYMAIGESDRMTLKFRRPN
jgi:predicted methyltransferase